MVSGRESNTEHPIIHGIQSKTARSGHFPPDPHWTGGWMGTSASLDVVTKTEISSPEQHRTSAFETVAIHFTD
jgi:hypothetical protein